MPRSPLALAALATVAVPGLDAFDVRRPAHPAAGVDTAVVIDATGRRWVVRAPQDAAAGAALEAEVALLQSLVAHVDGGDLPFDVPRPGGFAPLPEGGRAVVHPQLRGRPLRLELLGPGPGLAASVGRAIAALHELPVALVEDAGLPVYDAEAYRQRRLAEVDEAARTGHVPTALLRRWERALEDVAMWRFRPTVVHGDLSAEHVLCSGTEVSGVLGWSEAKVADPADDLAWLLVAAPQEGVDPILEAYNLRRTELSDRHLAARALLAGELALARWLLHGVRADDAAVVDDATAMLADLAEHTAEEAPEPAPAPAAAGWTLGTPSTGTAADGEAAGPTTPAPDAHEPGATGSEDAGTGDADPDTADLAEVDAEGAEAAGTGPEDAGPEHAEAAEAAGTGPEHAEADAVDAGAGDADPEAAGPGGDGTVDGDGVDADGADDAGRPAR
ncbi:phosphotransferase [Actinotalea solisilvae]|uniref:phosphotransferase n=1 Tax=Actinotalea solisilvae TaxID=2072922 RepID=UPI0027DCD5F8|nr:phosphotransferase [Actinotalea solisilvae]